MKTSTYAALVIAGLFLIGLQYYARFAAAPRIDFTTDDWSLLARARACTTASEAMEKTMHDPDRPFGAGLLTVSFKLFDDRPWAFILFSIATYSLLLFLYAVLVFLLTRNFYITLLSGVIFSILPNLTESFLWPTMICYGPGLVGYVASALFWVLFLQRRNGFYLLLSALCFAFGLGTYEVGIGLPIAFLAINYGYSFRKRCVAFLPFIAVIGFYLTWKFTKGFGMAHGVLFESRSIDLSISTILWNAKEVMSWWIGENMWNCLVQGWNGVALFSKWPWRLFLLGNLILAACTLYWLSRAYKLHRETLQEASSFLHNFIFSLLWFGAASAISLVSWSGGRLNFVPALGFSFLVALLLSRCRQSKWLAAFAVLFVLSLMANQGTALQWQESGQYHRRLFHHLMAHQHEWKQTEVLLIDTRSLRNRLTSDLSSPQREQPDAWAYYGNASLLRGFVPKAMLELIKPDGPWPTSVLDVECGAYFTDGIRLNWHERWDPSKPHITPLEKVYIVDALECCLD